MGYVVFAQREDTSVDLEGLTRNASRLWGATVSVIAPGRVHFERTSLGVSGSFTLRARPRSEADLAAAREAEQRGRAAGMATLAARCPTIWELEPDEGTSEAATLSLCAALAATALGPVLPADGSTLFGVRGSLERAEALTGGRTLRR